MGMRTWAALAATGLLVAGCTVGPGASTTGPDASTPPPGTATATRAAPSAPLTVPGYAYTDPGDVCGRFAAALYSADTTTDTGPVDAARRAAGYTDAALAAQLITASRDGRWQTWLAHLARVQADVSAYVEEEQPPDDSASAYRAVRVAATPIGADGWRGWTQTSIVYCTLGRLDTQWRVTGYTLAPPAGAP